MLPSMLVLILLLWTSTAHAVTYYVSKSGTNSHTCAQAQQASGARQSINATVTCLRSGDTLVIGAGTYAEILADTPTPYSVPLPNGVTVRAAPGARVVLRPGAREFPGGGGVITLSERARGISIYGLNIAADGQHTFGIYFDGTDLRFEDAEVSGARGNGVTALRGARMVFRGLYVHHNGQTDERRGHGFYVCGTQKVIEHNIVHDNSNYGIQVSCESGGIRDVTVRHNLVYNQPGRCYHVQGSGNRVYNNIGLRCAIGIGVRGSDTQVVHNTLVGTLPGGSGYGILTHSSGVQIANNLILAMPGGAIVGDKVTPNASHNACDTPQPGCSVVEPMQRLVRNAGSRDLHLMPGSKAIGAARPDLARMAPTDFDGNPRPMDGSPDIGAYEFGGTTRPMPTPGSGGPGLPPPGPPPAILPPPRAVRPVTTGTVLPRLPDTTPPPVAIVPTAPPAPPRVLA